MTYYEKMAFSEWSPVVSSTAQQGADQNHYFSSLVVINFFFSDRCIKQLSAAAGNSVIFS